MKKTFFTCIVMLFGLMGSFQTLPAQNNENLQPLIENVYSRNVVSLNGQWNRLIDPLESGYWDYRKRLNPNGYFKDVKVDNWKNFKEYDFDSAPTLFVPGDWNTQEDKLYYYESTVWYKKKFNVSKGQGRYYIYFGAANYEAKVYVNGKKVGEHEGGYTAFNFEVTEELNDGENFVIVKVDNGRRADAVPTDNFDWWNYGGITRDVMLVELPSTFIEDYTLRLKKGSKEVITFSAKLNGDEKNKSIRLQIPELKVDKEVTTNSEGVATLEIKAKPTLWSDTQPKLYTAIVSSGTETIKDEVGFRTIETRGKELLLNGSPIFLRGICIHEEAPYRSSRAFSRDDARTLLTWAKELGCNFVRLAHYPHNEHMVREAEKMGMLVWSEIPVYWTIDFANPVTLSNAKNQLNEMISRDKNRANIIIWSIANETPHGEARDLFLAQLSKHARSLDDSRLISMAMERGQYDNRRQYVKDAMNEYVDVISFNQYIGWYDGTWEKAEGTEWEIPYDKPVIVSEFGGGALHGLRGDIKERWTEDYQAELYRQTLKMIDRIPGVAGTTPWIMVDFRSSKRLLPGIQDDFNRKGLYTTQGEKKLAFYIMKDWYEQKKANAKK